MELSPDKYFFMQLRHVLQLYQAVINVELSKPNPNRVVVLRQQADFAFELFDVSSIVPK